MAIRLAVGGGIENNGGTVTINQSAFIGNYAGDGGAIYTSGGTVTINNSALTNNLASYGGGGIKTENGATLLLNDTTLTHNRTLIEAIGFGGGILNTESTATINHSTLVSNTATTSGGGIASYEGILIVENSTLSGNVAIYRGGAMLIDYSNDVTLQHSTIVDNVADDGDSISISGAAVSFTIANSIIISADQGVNCQGSSFTSLGYNLSDDASCNLTHPTDLQNTDPLLGPLADNGGATLTHALLPGSLAIDSGDNVNCPATDQRGVPRPQGAGCDRGAVEAVDIASRLDYAYVMNDGSAGQGRYTLFAGGSFLDEASGGGSWGAPAPDKLWLAYNAGYACDALLLGSISLPDQVRGLRLCRDGSGARGVWQATVPD
ncbi:MAG: hypothetical protein Fur0021_08240 [Candidatus Promineifilaceae bacterium]